MKRATDTFLFISHTTNVLLFKFRCNIFIGVRVIKEMPGSVASGTNCIMQTALRAAKENKFLNLPAGDLLLELVNSQKSWELHRSVLQNIMWDSIG